MELTNIYLRGMHFHVQTLRPRRVAAVFVLGLKRNRDENRMEGWINQRCDRGKQSSRRERLARVGRAATVTICRCHA